MVFNQCSIYKTRGGETQNWGLAFRLFLTNKKVFFYMMTSQTVVRLFLFSLETEVLDLDTQ